MVRDESPRPDQHADHREIRSLPMALVGLAAVALGAAIQRREGLFSAGAMAGLATAVLATLAAVICRTSCRTASLLQRRDPQLAHLPAAVLILGLAWQFASLYRHYPGSLWNTPPGDARRQLSQLKDDFTWIVDPEERAAAAKRIRQTERQLLDSRYQAGIVAAMVLSALALLPCRRIAIPALVLVLLLHFTLGVWLLRRTPDPFIDVYVFQQESCQVLLRGQNPYAATFTNIYGPDAYVYAPDLMKEGRVNFGYPYMPLTLLLSLPGYAMTGDSRYAQLAAMTVSGALIAAARPGLLATLAALLLLFTPRTFMIAEMAWTEPFVALLLAGTVFCFFRLPRALPVALGLLLASKQYMVLAIPLVWMLASGNGWRSFVKLILLALAVAAGISLPLMLWDLPAFLRSAVTLQLIQPFRKDSVSFLAWLAWYVPEPAVARHAWVAFAAAFAGIALAIRCLPRGAAGFAWGTASTYLLFLAFNKQAFCNYYYFVIASLCCTIAAQDPRKNVDHDSLSGVQTPEGPPRCPVT